MSNVRPTLLTLLVTPFFACAFSVLIWNFDALDTFYDPQIDQTVDCAYWLEQALTAHGHTCVTSNALPTNLDLYDMVFITLGWYRC